MVLNRFNRRARSFWGDSAGGTIPIVAAGLMISVAAASLGVDLVMARTNQQALELSADAAALAAAARLPDVSAARDAAMAYVEKNMPRSEYGMVLDPEDVQIGKWDQESRAFIASENQRSGADATAVRVVTRLAADNGNPMSAIFASVIGVDSLDVSGSAIAGRGGAPCLLTLDPDEKGSLQVKSKGEVEATNCGVQVNSASPQALRLDGNAELKASSICVSGTTKMAASSLTDSEPREHCPGRADPLAAMKLPEYGVCDERDVVLAHVEETLSPGVYCGGLQITDESAVDLEPGLYVIKDGPLIVDGHSSLSGERVTILLTGSNASLQFDDSAVIEMSAPTDGEMKGVLVFQDPDFDNDHDWDGDASTNLQGVIYLPTGTLTADSGNHVTPYKSCTVLIVKNLTVINKSSVSIDLSGSKCRNSLPTAYSRGVVLLQ